MSDEFARLGQLTRLDPPPQLDALVQQRMQLILDASQSSAEAGSAFEVVAVSLPQVERWIYAAGLCTYAGQVLSGAARLLWRTVTG